MTRASPQFAPPFVELALAEWRLGEMQQAYKDSLTAERLEPWRSGYRLLTGRILLRGNQPALAAQYSRTIASHWFGSDHNEAVDLWTSIPAEKRGDGPAPIIEIPDGAQAVRGTLTEVSCPVGASKHYSVTVQPESPADDKPSGNGQKTPLILGSDQGVRVGFTDTLWFGEDHFSSCHHLTGRSVVAFYKPDGDNRGTLLELEIRDDFPSTVHPSGARASSVSSAAAPGAAGTQP